ncbi:hypothetical protein CC1G_05845 [Coprinopsis cinerea okayama7|uniref:F-box domain-containing protein n=1 Tax=Coprinopsis cinerea (strain Okayama-7 / 130 / ATCC MYA-4618 / FGSC 9003) TaxID=240176 RepID=A8NLK1_COPC7|nr:hypothetical protein CC1G_05845 [Coprinopsis cinerea okayama7\|eukprot:XP_001834708.2 hypothetical protein CC1G_05845 [Coprinopsis cinerea okayama7\
MSESEPEGYALQDRLKHLIQPKQPEGKKAGRPIAPAAPARYYLNALPPSVVLEVSRYLKPRDLLSLSRATNHVREVLSSPNSQRTWEKVLLLDPELPRRPSDMTAQEFICFLLQEFCMICNATAGITRFWGLRLMLCNVCKVSNIVDGHQIIEKEGEANYKKIVPSLLFHCKYDPPCRCKVKDHLENHVYFHGDVKFVIDGMKDLRTAYEKGMFLRQRKRLMTQLMSSVPAMLDWKHRDAFARLKARDSRSEPFSKYLRSTYSAFREALPWSVSLPETFDELEQLGEYRDHFAALLASDEAVPQPLPAGAQTCAFSEKYFGNLLLEVENGSPDALYDLICTVRPEYKSQPKPTILLRASTLLSCKSSKYDCCGLFRRPGLFNYPEISSHARSPKVDSRFIEVAEDVLEALGYARDVSRATIGSVEGRLVCKCGWDPKGKAMRLCELVTHIIAEQDYYEKILKGAQERKIELGTKPNILINVHAKERYKKLIKISSKEPEDSGELFKSIDHEFYYNEHPEDRYDGELLAYCGPCYRMAKVSRTFPVFDGHFTVEDHVKQMHQATGGSATLSSKELSELEEAEEYGEEGSDHRSDDDDQE